MPTGVLYVIHCRGPLVGEELLFVPSKRASLLQYQQALYPILHYNRESMCHDERKSQTKSCECIIIHQDELYIASSTLQEIIHIVKDKYEIKINPHVYLGSNFPYDPGGTLIS